MQTNKALPGTKPWISKQHLTSSGLSALDEVLGGGFALGTIVLVHDDAPSDLSQVIMRYFVGQGIANGHKTLLAGSASSSMRMLEKIPCSLTYAKLHDEHPLADAKQAGIGHGSGSNLNLKIAWQYERDRRGVMPAGLGTSPDSSTATDGLVKYCHSFDLNATLQKPLMSANSPYLCDPLAIEGGTGMSCAILIAVLQDLAIKGGESVVRVALPFTVCESSWGDVWTRDSSAVNEFVQFILALKDAVRHLPVVVMITSPPLHLSKKLLRRMEAAMDTVFGLDSFATTKDAVPREFDHLDGLLHVRKLQSVNALTCSRPVHRRYGLKRERRKLRIEPLHLPPEPEQASVLNGVCSTGMGAGSNGGLLAF